MKSRHERRRKRGVRVLVATDLRIYRDVICSTLQTLRPHAEIHAANPENLDETVLRLSPGLVVCSRRTPLVERRVPAWVELYPEHDSRAVVEVAGKRTEHQEASFDVLVSTLDLAERLYEFT